MFKHLPQPQSGISDPPYRTDLTGGSLEGLGLVKSERRLGDLAGFFEGEAARRAMPADPLIYRVVASMPVPEGKKGNRFFGTSFIEPGQVGEEYFMTKGHLRRKIDTA